MKYDYLITGAGITGCVIAEQLTRIGKKVLIIDQRNHIGGLCYTEEQSGIQIHKYGPHIFHTNNIKIWNYINKRVRMIRYEHRVKTLSRGEIFQCPINLLTLHRLWGVCAPQDAERILQEKKVSIANPRNAEEVFLSQVGEELYKRFYYGYTKKQWGIEPCRLSPQIATRVKIRTDFDDRYFTDQYQGLPKAGYTEFFQRLTEKSEVKLQTPYRSSLKRLCKKHIYTGSIDELFNFKFGKLEYRHSHFNIIISKHSHYGCPVMNLADANIPFTRIAEQNYLNPNKPSDVHIIYEERSINANNLIEAYYPIINEKNNILYRRYYNLLPSDTFVCGRLGEYKYIDMCQAIENSLGCARLALGFDQPGGKSGEDNGS